MSEPIVTGICIGGDAEVAKQPVSAVTLTLEGLPGDRHAGPLRTISFGRDRGIVVFNDRQWSGVSEEEVARLEVLLKIALPLGSLGENFRFEGIEGFSRLTAATALSFPSGAQLMVAGRNLPCRKTAASLARLSGNPEVRRAFVPVARRIRGLVGWVEAPSVVHLGDAVLVTPNPLVTPSTLSPRQLRLTPEH